MENMAFIFGVSGLAFAFIALGQVHQLKKEVQELKDR